MVGWTVEVYIYISDRIASFRKHLDVLDIEFDFANAPIESTPAPGVDIFYEPPYYSFWEGDSLDDIQTARKWLTGYIAQHGPYDAVLALQASSEAILAQGANRWDNTKKMELSDEELRAEIQGPVKIDIPTVHIYGDKDPRYAAGVQLSAFCNQDKVKTFNHEGGHDIPRKDAVSRQIALLVAMALEEADLV